MNISIESDKITIETLYKQISVFLVGPGRVGSRLLKQIDSQASNLKKRVSIEIKIIAIADTKKMLFDPKGINTANWEENLLRSPNKTSLDLFINKMVSLPVHNKVFIDCTASDEVVEKYKSVLENGISIVTPNKKSNSRDYKFYEDIRRITKEQKVNFLYETNVGAALPIIGTIKDLVNCGDEIIEIKGILSGALSYIFNSFVNGKPFSEIVKDAKEKGYTEPDPREDLNGLDVARKLLILSREIGMKIELNDIEVESLVPKEIETNSSVDRFFEELKVYDKYFEAKRNEALKKGKVLKYVATLNNEKVKAGLEEIDKGHSLNSLTGSDNIIYIKTKLYKKHPLVIKGPGAGADVTAAGILSDLIKVF